MNTLNVIAESVIGPSKLYRVGQGTTKRGLWYDDEGYETGIIHTLTNAAAAKLPMDPHPIFRMDEKKWVSATNSLENLRRWFSAADMIELAERGFELMELEVTGHMVFDFGLYAHEVFCPEQIQVVRTLPTELVYPK